MAPAFLLQPHHPCFRLPSLYYIHPSFPFFFPMPTPPYARQKGPGRPPNAWIIYRKTMLPTLPPVPPGQPRRCQAEVSRIISKMWREEPDHVKAEYERMAEQEKALHLQLNPGYKFSPVSKAEKDKLKAAEAAQKELDRSNSKKGRNRGGPYMVPILAAPSSAHVLPAYYDPARLFGHAGPSPHMSGASSPTSTKSAPLHLPRSDQASQSHPTRSSSHSSPIAETYQNQQNYRPSSAPVTYLTPMPPPQTRQVHPPLPNPDLYQPQLHSQPQQHETFAVDLTPWNHNPTYDGQVTMHGVSAEVRRFTRMLSLIHPSYTLYLGLRVLSIDGMEWAAERRYP